MPPSARLGRGSGPGWASTMTGSIGHAARGFVLVFVSFLAFFAFVIGSGLLGGIGQSVISFVFGVAGLSYAWSRLDPQTRQRWVDQTRAWLHRTPTS
jgi:hypothetical protein